MHRLIKKIFSYIFIVTLFLTFNLLYASGIYSFQDFSKDDQKQLEKVIKLNEEARDLLNEITELYVEIERLQNSGAVVDDKTQKKIDKYQEDIFDKQLEAYSLQQDANRMEYDVYINYVETVRSNVASGSNEAIEAKLLEEQASENFYKANTLREQSLALEIEERINNLSQAQEYEKLGLTKLKQSCDLFTGKSTSSMATLSTTVSDGLDGVEVNEEVLQGFMDYMSNNNLPVSELLRESISDDMSLQEQFKTALNTYALEEEPIVEQLLTEETTSDSETDSISSMIAETIEPSDETTEGPLMEDIEYKIEIAADKANLQQGALQKLYESDKELLVENQDGWQKYVIKGFKSFDEADKFKKELGMDDAFISPIKPTQEITERKIEIDEPSTIEESTLMAGITFKVQIAADRSSLSDQFIKNIYSGSENVDLIREEGWYKYSVGQYNTFEEAANLQKKVRIPDAFIVAYKDGKKVPLYLAKQGKATGATAKGPIEYKVQIAADVVQLHDTKIKEIYPGPELVFVKREDQWYKYSIGSETRLTDAKQLLSRCGVSGAFIVAYQGGAKVNPYSATSTDSDCFEPKIVRDWGDQSNIIFKIQIAASKTPLSPIEIKEIYCKEKEVFLFIEEGWYKYSVGEFIKYSNAKEFKQNIGVHGAFMVAFKNAQKLNIKEAIKLSN